MKIIEEEIKQGKLGGPAGNNKLGYGDDGRQSLPRQPIPNVKKHINLDPQEWRTSSPELCANTLSSNMFNDLNVMSSPNIDEINNLNKYTRSYDPLYNSFGLNGINIPALGKDKFTAMENNQRNMSPISSQISATESNSITRQIVSRTKIPHNAPRNPFAETYRANFPNLYADGFIANDRAQSMSPRNITNSPNRLTNNSGGVAGATAVPPHYDHNSLYLNHPRQISGTYSSNMENAGAEKLAFPYNVIPPPRSKLDSRSNQPQSINSSRNVNGHGASVQQQRLNFQRQMQRAKTPEILLAPHYLDNARVYYDWVAREPVYRLQNRNNKQHQHHVVSSGDENLDDHDDSILEIRENGYRVPSDIDSQVNDH